MTNIRPLGVIRRTDYRNQTFIPFPFSYVNTLKMPNIKKSHLTQIKPRNKSNSCPIERYTQTDNNEVPS